MNERTRLGDVDRSVRGDREPARPVQERARRRTVVAAEGSSDGERARAGDVVEMQLPLADLGIGDQALVHVNMVYEGSGSESTYAGVPSSSFTPGFDPDFLSWLDFDLADEQQLRMNAFFLLKLGYHVSVVPG